MLRLLDQPKGLFTLCFTELWERFGYYFLQTLFVLFLTRSVDFSQHNADLLFGAFSALLYITPVLGGWLADHFIGFRRAIIVGAGLLFFGYALLMFSKMAYFYVGLGFLIAGNGFFKPNVSSIVGDLYGEDEARREGGFTLFYMGINLGSFFPPLIAFSVVSHWGWHIGFALAAAGMLLSVATFLFGRPAILHIGQVPKESPLLGRAAASLRFTLIAVLGVVFAIGLSTTALFYPDETGKVVIAAAVLFVLVMLVYLWREPKDSRRKMIASLILIVLSIVFWTLYSESFSALMFFAESNMNKHLFGVAISAEFTQVYNGFFIIVLSPFFNYCWRYLDRYQLNPSIPLKFALGIAFMCLGYLLLTWGTNGDFGLRGVISGWWLIGSYFLQTIGELLLSPIGLAMITVLSPKHLVGMMMGLWFFSLAAASALSGFLATWAASPAHVSAVEALKVFHHAFGLWTALSALATLVALIAYPGLKRMIAPAAVSV